MSQTVSISKEVDLDVRVYDVVCRCGTSLSFDVHVDSDNDLQIKVDTHSCEQE